MLPLRSHRSRVKVRRFEQLRIELHRRLVLALGLLVPQAQRRRQTARHVRLRQFRLELEGFAARNVRLPDVELTRIEICVEQRIAIGDARVRARVFRIDLDRLVEHLLRVLQRLATELVKVLPAAQVELVSLDVNRARATLLDRPLLVLAQNYSQRLHDRLRDIILNREDILQLTVVALGPQVISISDVHQLRGDAELVPHLPYTALEHRRHLELAPDVADVFAPALERERRRARGDAQ